MPDFSLHRRMGGLEAVAADRSPETEVLDGIPTPRSAGLESLPEQFRMAVILCDIEQFSYKEIANILDVPIGTVDEPHPPGRKLLQTRLLGLCGRPTASPPTSRPIPMRYPVGRQRKSKKARRGAQRVPPLEDIDGLRSIAGVDPQ